MSTQDRIYSYFGRNPKLRVLFIFYTEILQRAVALIEKARSNVARHVSVAVSNTYWNIGKLLHEKKLESKHDYTHRPPAKVRYGVLLCPLSASASNKIEVDAFFFIFV